MKQFLKKLLSLFKTSPEDFILDYHGSNNLSKEEITYLKQKIDKKIR